MHDAIFHFNETDSNHQICNTLASGIMTATLMDPTPKRSCIEQFRWATMAKHKSNIHFCFIINIFFFQIENI